MRVLVVTPKLPELSADGTRSAAATMASVARQLRSLRAVGVELDVLQIEGIPRLRYLQCYPRVIARSRHADIVHAHYGYCGWLARGQSSVPVVLSLMGTDLLGVPRADGSLKVVSRLVGRADRWLSTRVAATIVKSQEMASVLPGPAHVIPNGVDLTEFAPIEQSEARRRLGLDPDGTYVLFGGKPSNPRKGFPLARETVNRASALLGRPVELLVLSGVDPAQVPLFMSAAEALVMTSLMEGSPNVVKEAMACNLPVVSVPVGDVSFLLDGVSASEVVPRDGDALAARLADVLGAGERSDGREALRRKGLDDESIAHRVAELYAMVARNASLEAVA